MQGSNDDQETICSKEAASLRSTLRSLPPQPTYQVERVRARQQHLSWCSGWVRCHGTVVSLDVGVTRCGGMGWDGMG